MDRFTSIETAIVTLPAARIDELLAEIETAMAFATLRNAEAELADLVDEHAYVCACLTAEEPARLAA